MVRILYGVSGDGSGHATRSKVIIEHLLKKHEVAIVGGDKAYSYLSRYFKNTYKIFALRLMHDYNKVNNLRTAIYNIKEYPRGRKESLRTLYALVAKFKPEIIITDFEYFTSLISRKFKIPSICIDNNHIMNVCRIEVPKKEISNYLAASMVVKSIVKGAKYYLITTFFYPKKKKKNVFLFPPILRDEVRMLKPKIGDYILVYQSSDTNKQLIETLKEIGQKFIVYGFNKSKREKNIIFRKFNENVFFRDLSNCKAVITNGGFSLISEALTLQKPVLSVPIRKQFEQVCNAVYIDKLKYGEYHKKFTKNIVERFIEKIPYYRNNLKYFKKSDNKELFAKLDIIIERLSRKD